MPSISQKVTAVALISLLVWANALAQTQTQSQPQTPPQKSQDEVVRVYTELVQTDVMVFDRQGRFVDNLTKENFELRIDGKPREILAFEKISAGSNEESQLAAARGTNTVNLKRPVPLDRGRIVFFYLDDFHMDLPSIAAARKVINTFIDKQMGQNDQVAIASATGQIGFLQQLTNDRMVLSRALERVSPNNYSVRDFERPPMSEYEAVLIDRQDPIINFFISETIRQNPGMTRETAASIVRGRAQAMLTQAARFNYNTLSGLASLVKSARNLPGRKVVFFLSGGFLIEGRRGTEVNQLRDITNAAAKSGVVIYSMDTRGLVATLHGASAELGVDLTGQLERAEHGELLATQDPLNALAVDTGGKAIFNTNDLTQGLAPAMKETSTYYLLAWKPDAESQKEKRFRNLEVKLVNRSDLTVRVRKGFFDLDPSPPAPVASDKKTDPAERMKTAASKLREAISAAYPERSLPILLSADYYDVAGKGPTVSTAIQIPGEFLSFSQQPDGKVQAIVDLSGVYYDEKGTLKTSFMERLVTTAPSLEAAKNYRSDITFNYPAVLPAGLHQVRVAARDDKSGRVGSAHAWIDIPDLARKRFAMSSLLLGERTQPTVNVSDSETNVSDSETIAPVALSASHRFRRDSTLRFLLFAYNATFSPADHKPDLAVQVQVIRDDQPVLTTSLRKIATDGILDLARIPYAAEIPLNTLLPGRYLLQIAVIDRVAKQSTMRQTHFDVY